eukprot:6198498-Pleurochrysis_carterae.AAC.3
MACSVSSSRRTTCLGKNSVWGLRQFALGATGSAWPKWAWPKWSQRGCCGWRQRRKGMMRRPARQKGAPALEGRFTLRWLRVHFWNCYLERVMLVRADIIVIAQPGAERHADAGS